MSYKLCKGYYLSLAEIRDDINNVLSKDPTNTHEEVCQALKLIAAKVDVIKQNIIADY